VTTSFRRGTVVIVVLVVVMMISLAAYHFTLTMESEHLATRNTGDRAAMRQTSLSGTDVIAAIMEQPRSERSRLSQVVFTGVELWETEDQGPSLYRVDFSLTQLPVSDFSGRAQLIDESSKLNLNKLMDWDLLTPGHAREALLRLPEMDEATADRLLDWIDADDEPRWQGDELGSPDAVPHCVDELMWLPKEDRQTEPEPLDSKRDQRQRRPAWMDHLTVDSSERNESFNGRPRINVNSDDLKELHLLLTRELPLEVANYIVMARQYGLQPMVDSTSTSIALEIDFTLEAAYEFAGLGELIGSSVAVSRTPLTQVINSPIQRGAIVGGEPIDELFDRLTTIPETRIEGRINLATAPAEVIAAIPGLNLSLAQKIVSARSGLSQSFRHPIGILHAAGIDPVIVNEVLSETTIAGDVLRIGVMGRIDEHVLAQGYEAVIDASTPVATVRILRPMYQAMKTEQGDRLFPPGGRQF